MKPTAIEIGQKYEVALSRGTSVVKVVRINPKNGSWICETASGKDLTISDAKRFLRPFGSAKGKAAPEPKAASVKGKKESKPAPQVETDPETLEKLTQAVKEANKKWHAAMRAHENELITLQMLDHVHDEWEQAKSALKEAGGKMGKGGRCQGRMSGLDAAYQVLVESGESMNTRRITEIAMEKGYWSPEGATPEATITSAILREIQNRGDQSRFIRTGKGLFAAR